MEVSVNGEVVPETTGNALVRLEDIPGGHAACDAEIARLRERADRAEAKFAEYENAITWNTSCLSCAAVLDSSVRETFRREAAEEMLGKIREIAESWAARAPAVRTIAQEFVMSPHDAVSSDCGREILAIIGGEAEEPPATARRLPEAAIAAAAEAIDWEYYTNQGRHIERWARDIAIGALEAAWPFLPTLGGVHGEEGSS